MRHLDLFAGIGGFSLAARWMGWETVAQVEWDEWCQKVLAKNFPDALRFGDIVEFNKMLENGKITTDTEKLRNKREPGALEDKAAETGKQDDGAKPDRISENGLSSIGRIDIITGGFPCQPFSHAGKRKGTDDSRYLWPAMLETIRRVKPTYVVGENVAGLVSMEGGKTLDRILSDLENEGYTTEQVIIPACAVGAWHRRDRIWIIAHSLNRTDRTVRGQGGEAEGVPCECGEAGCAGMSCGTNSEVRNNAPNCKIQGLEGRDNAWDTKQNESRFRKGSWAVGSYWLSEPSVGRVANGIPNRVDRLKGLGNAIVPQVAYEIFKAIETHNKLSHGTAA